MPETYSGKGGGGGQGGTPNGCWWFTLCTNDEQMVLVSMGPVGPPQQVSFLQPATLVVLLMTVLAMAFWRRRQIQ